MGHRAKHRHAALLRRAEAGRKIKSDLTPLGAWRYEKAEDELRGRKIMEALK
jgi:hypothetical protein